MEQKETEKVEGGNMKVEEAGYILDDLVSAVSMTAVDMKGGKLDAKDIKLAKRQLRQALDLLVDIGKQVAR